jgi:Zn-dependent protease
MGLLSLLLSDPLVFLVFILVFLATLSVHEFAHAWAGALLGDQTAKRFNRLTLNPLAHIDPLGFLSLLLIGFGWGKPVPFNPYNLKYPRWGPALVAAAGPFSNLVLGTACALGYRSLAPLLGLDNLLVMLLGFAIHLNFLLMFFNLIPLPPLDGSKALLAVLADEKYRSTRHWLETQGPTVLVGIILLDAFFSLHLFSFLSVAAEALGNFILSLV